jgi:hypothetical protein
VNLLAAAGVADAAVVTGCCSRVGLHELVTCETHRLSDLLGVGLQRRRVEQLWGSAQKSSTGLSTACLTRFSCYKGWLRNGC